MAHYWRLNGPICRAMPCVRATTDYDQGDYTAKAQSAYQKAANNIGRYNAGNAAMQQNQLQEAVDFYSAAAEKSTSAAFKADALYNLGNAYLQQKKYSAAIKAYESSLRVAPNRPDAQKNLQIAKRQLQEPPPPPPSPPPPPPPPSTRPPAKVVFGSERNKHGKKKFHHPIFRLK